MKILEESKKDFFSCLLFPRCSGCKSLVEVRNPPIWKDVKCFFNSLNYEIKLVSKEIIGWRSKAKLAVRDSEKGAVIGLFEENSHLVVNIDQCPLHYEKMNLALKKIHDWIKACGIKAYDEKKHAGSLKYIQMVFNPKKSSIQLTLVFNAVTLKEEEKLFVKMLYNEFFFHSIWVNFCIEKTNSIFGKKWELLEGEEDFFQEIRGISFCFHPSCFSQAHISLFEEMIAYIDDLVSKNATILELYAGVGCIGLSLAYKANKVILVESSPLAKNSFEKSIPNELKEKCFFFSGTVESLDLPWQEAEVIIVDPPRKGLSKDCKNKIFQSNASQLVYVSCGYLSFIRDAKEIIESGWVLEHARGFLLFPGTNHVELVASFRKIFNLPVSGS